MFELFIDLAVVRVFRSKWGAEFIQYRPCFFSLHSTPGLLNHHPAGRVYIRHVPRKCVPSFTTYRYPEGILVVVAMA